MGVWTTEQVGRENPAQDGKGPGGGDDHPSFPAGLGALEQARSHHPVAEQHHHEGAGEFSQ
jgi:hypothetical protein